MKWIIDHWLLLLSIQQALALVASLAYGQLDQLPRWHAFFSLLASSGVDVPKVIDSWRRWLSNSPTPPPKSGSQNPPPLSRRPPPPPGPMPIITRDGRKVWPGRLGLGAICIVACHLGPPPADVTTDFEKLAECVAENYSDWPNLLAKCSGYTLAELEAAIQWLLADPKFAAAHPTAIGPLQERLGQVRAEKAKRE